MVNIFFILITGLYAQNVQENPNVKSLKVGLALSGGGARGIAHIGVIQALEEEGIPIDMIAGTSMGSIVGGLYACGYSAAEQREIIHRIDWDHIFNQRPEPRSELVCRRYGMKESLIRFQFKFWDIYTPLGLISGQHISDELFRYTTAASFAAKSKFDSLAVPFRAMAVDVSTGEIIALKEGELAQAIHASMALPLLFYPVRIGDRILFDGGVLNILPTNIVKEMGADVVIAVDLEKLFPLGKEPKHIADIAKHTIDIAIRELKKGNIKIADVLVEPDLGGHSEIAYNRFDSLIEMGYQAAMDKMDEIKRLIPLQIEDRNISRRQLNKNALEQAVISKIDVVGNDYAQRSVIAREFALQNGDTFNIDLAIQGTRNIYVTGLFENVWVELDNLGKNQVGINIHVIEKYPRTIGFGANYRSEEGFSGFIQFVNFNFFGWGERFMPFLRYGELDKRLGIDIVNDRFFATPLVVHNSFCFEQGRPYLYDPDGHKLGQLEMDRMMGQFSLGIQLHRKFLTTAGLGWERIWLERSPIIGLSSEISEHWKGFGQILFDNTDHRYFPNQGIRLSLEGETVIKFNSDIEPYTKFQANLDWAFSLPQSQTIITYLEVGISKKVLPVYQRFRIGGPTKLPGYHRDEIWGPHSLSIGLIYRIKMFKLWYFQGSWSAANTYNDYHDLTFDSLKKGFSVGVVALSPIGPLAFIYGWGEHNREQGYFSIGYEF
ncbi:patatin-like phospholipase family protein [candidate division WOR-3 bacterium]|nr:patatin-like phospholipase family protein [candidate division WOR-3 bacterium]